MVTMEISEKKSNDVHKPVRQSSMRTIFHRTSDMTVKNFIRFYSSKFCSNIETVQLHDKTSGLIIKELDPVKNFLPPKNPIVLCHGLSGFDKLILVPFIGQIISGIANSMSLNKSQEVVGGTKEPDGLLGIEYWNGVKKHLEAKGCTVITAKVPSFGTIEERSQSLHEFLEKEVRKLKEKHKKNEVYNDPTKNTQNDREFESDEKIALNIIAHSLGGLDSRYLISNTPHENYKIASLTTISSPHHGSEIADFIVEQFESLKSNTSLKDTTLVLPKVIYQLTTKNMKHFNEVTPNDPSVAYFSYGCYFTPKWHNMFFPSWNISHQRSNGQNNDGMVTVESSKWGEYRGTLVGVDHLDIINWKNKFQLNISNFMGQFSTDLKGHLEPSIDILEFYLTIANDLALKGY